MILGYQSMGYQPPSMHPSGFKKYQIYNDADLMLDFAR